MFNWLKPKQKEQPKPKLSIAAHLEAQRKLRDDEIERQERLKRERHNGEVEDLAPILRKLREFESSFKGSFNHKSLSIEPHMQKDDPEIEVFLGYELRARFSHGLNFYIRFEIKDEGKWKYRDSFRGDDADEAIYYFIDFVVKNEDH